MNTNKEFVGKLIDVFVDDVVIDGDNIISICIERDDEEIVLALETPMGNTNINLMFSFANTGKNIFATVTDGPTEDLALYFEFLENYDPERLQRNEVVNIAGDFLRENGVHGMFISSMCYFEFCDHIPDVFEYKGQEYPIKALLFLSKHEVETFHRNTDEFFDLIGEKDPVKFNQN
jgi:hypothetical protein